MGGIGWVSMKNPFGAGSVTSELSHALTWRLTVLG